MAPCHFQKSPEECVAYYRFPVLHPDRAEEIETTIDDSQTLHMSSALLLARSCCCIRGRNINMRFRGTCTGFRHGGKMGPVVTAAVFNGYCRTYRANCIQNRDAISSAHLLVKKAVRIGHVPAAARSDRLVWRLASTGPAPAQSQQS